MTIQLRDGKALALGAAMKAYVELLQQLDQLNQDKAAAMKAYNDSIAGKRDQVAKLAYEIRTGQLTLDDVTADGEEATP